MNTNNYISREISNKYTHNIKISITIANSVSRILALSSHSVRCPSVRPLSVLKRHTQPYLHYMTIQTTRTKYFLKAYDMHYPFTQHHSLNPQIQIHKCTNTQIQLRSKLQIDLTCAIFLKRLWYEDTKKQCSRVCDMQIHKYNYTNTQIQFVSNLQIDLTCAIFLKRSWHQDLKNNVPDCLTCNYTNTQIKFEGDAPKVIKNYHIKGKAHKFQYGKCRIRPVYSVQYS